MRVLILISEHLLDVVGVRDEDNIWPSQDAGQFYARPVVIVQVARYLVQLLYAEVTWKKKITNHQYRLLIYDLQETKIPTNKRMFCLQSVDLHWRFSTSGACPPGGA